MDCSPTPTAAELVGQVTAPDGTPQTGLLLTVSRGGDSPSPGDMHEFRPPHGADVLSATTDAEGRYRFTPPAGAAVLTACPQLPWLPLQAHAVDVPASGRVTLDLQLERAPDARMIQGVVVDPRGAPVAGAVLTVGIYAPSLIRDSDAAGRFVVYIPYAYDDVEVSVASPGFLPTRRPFVLGERDARIELDWGAVATARLTTPADDPLPDELPLEVYARGGCPAGRVEGGVLRASGIMPGLPWLVLHAEGWLPQLVSRPLEVGPNDLGALTLDRGESLTVKVLDAHGGPVEHAPVYTKLPVPDDEVFVHLGATNPEGELTARGVPASGSVDLQLGEPSGFGRWHSAHTGKRTVEVNGPVRETFVLHRGVTLSGRVVWAGEGPAPWSGKLSLGIELHGEDGGGQGWVESTQPWVGDEGVPFDLTAPTGRWNLSVRLRVGEERIAPTVRLDAFDIPEPPPGEYHSELDLGDLRFSN